MAVDLETPRRSGSSTLVVPEEARRIGVVLGWLGVVVPFVAEAFAIVRANHNWLLHRLPDDGFYYLQVARHLARGDGFTFDGVHETNGFHPLWQMLLVPLGRAFPDGDAMAKAALILGVGLSLIAVILVIQVVRRVVGIGPALFGALVAVHGTNAIGGWANGMEGPAVLLTLALVLTALAHWARDPEPRRAVIVGALCSVAVLARFDLVAVLWVVPVAMARRGRSVRCLLHWLLGAGAVGVPFAAAWLLRWRHVLTTSATVKDTWLADLMSTRYGGRWSTGYMRFLFDTAWDYAGSIIERVHPGKERAAVLVRIGLLGLALVGAGTRIRGDHRRGVDATTWAVVVMIGVVALKALVDLVAAPLWATAWYAAPQQLVVPFVVGVFAWIGVRRVVAWSAPVGAAVAVLAVLLVLPTNLLEFTVSGRREPIPSRWQDELDVAAAWIRDEGPAGRYGAYDAGLLGFELDGSRTVVNLDGLVNNYEFAELVAAHASAAARIEFTEVDYVVNRLTDERLASEFACATPVWRSELAVPYRDSANRAGTEGFIHVLDVRGCRGS